MIKVGDKVILDGVEYFVNDIKSGSVSLYKEKNPLSVMFMNEKTLYKQLYKQQKQRADVLEKRWHKLKEHFIKEKEQSFGMLSWSRNNGVLELIEKLEENNNA